MLDLADRIDRLNGAVGRTMAWAALFIVLTQFAVVALRSLTLWAQAMTAARQGPDGAKKGAGR